MDLVTICREEGRKQATEWLKGAIDAPNPYALMRGSSPRRISQRYLRTTGLKWPESTSMPEFGMPSWRRIGRKSDTWVTPKHFKACSTSWLDTQKPRVGFLL